MRWSNTVSDEVVTDARETYKAITNKSLPQKKVANGALKVVDVDWFLKENVDNAGLHRIELARKGRDPYPDAPRGKADHEALKHFTTTKKSVSPIVVTNVNGQWTLLDGVHRLVSASMTNSKVKVLFV
jgi:hypothetical protein